MNIVFSISSIVRLTSSRSVVMYCVDTNIRFVSWLMIVKASIWKKCGNGSMILITNSTMCCVGSYTNKLVGSGDN